MRKIYYAIGAMSGTSGDGIDVSLIKTDGLDYFEPILNLSIAFEKNLKKKILSLAKTFKDKRNHYKIIKTEDLLTQKYIAALKKILNNSGLKQSDITVLGLHGQTVFHDPKNNISLQLINTKKISRDFNIQIISNFRENDIINGGQGAPLVPVFHRLIMKYLKITEPCIFINIGGIANITYVSKNDDIIAFDTGPGMCLLDDYISRNSNNEYDKNGEFSSRGNVNYDIVEKNMSDKYFKVNYPKSLDRNYFSLNTYKHLNFNDACATISMFTITSIYQGIKKINKDYGNIFIVGGGSRNLFIKRELSILTQNKVKLINMKKLKDCYIESQAFGYLAVRSIKKLPISYPQTTGVKKPTLGGEVS